MGRGAQSCAQSPTMDRRALRGCESMMALPVTVRFRETRWYQVIPPRSLTEWEYSVLDLLLSRPFPGSADLRKQAETVRVSAACGCCLSLMFTGADEVPRQPSNAHHGHVNMAMVAELDGLDQDGVPFWALLFVHDGFLAELEIQRADGAPFVKAPDFERHEPIEGSGAT